ncbi:MAG: ribonuclease P protein component [Alphaproteobacteria bacterium]|nr:ribonuclease P protein component [Alphaproteobacteria bacterium]
MTLKKRKYFVEAAKGYKAVTNGVVIQAALRLPCADFPPSAIACGYTATKKLGKAHLRNYTKRRLREVARALLPVGGVAGVNYVFIGRHNTTTLNFAYLQRKAAAALQDINRQIVDDIAQKNAQVPDNTTD